MNKKVIGYVSLKVKSLDNMIGYYTEVIGLDVIKKEGREAWLGVDKEILLHFVELNEYTVNVNATGLYHTAFLVPNRSVLGSFLAHIINHNSFVGASDHGYSEAIYLEDIEGNGIEVYCDKPLESWDIRDNGNIVGITTYIDYMGLLKEAGSPFKKMPKGTFIGHIHLTVAELDKTEKFYTDILELDLKLNYVGMAKFFSYYNYHHHIGTNTWKGTMISSLGEKDLGLNYFTLILGEEKFNNIKAKIIKNNMKFRYENGWLEIKDSNGITIHLISNNKK